LARRLATLHRQDFALPLPAASSSLRYLLPPTLILRSLSKAWLRLARALIRS
jgi:hypothetical protein